MRNLYLLQGPQGSGKSTLIKDLGLENNCLSFDTFRQFFGTSRSCLDGTTTLSISTRDGSANMVIEACVNAAKSRMAVGDTLVIDNMNVDIKDYSMWKKLANKYSYDVITVDVLGDTSDEELLNRNATRGYKSVDDTVLLKSIAKARSVNFPGTVIDSSELLSHIYSSAERMRISAKGYSRVVVIGDVHGYANELKKIVEPYGGLENKDNLYIFVGDLFDRGPDSGAVMSHIFPFIGSDNVHFIEGNHETNLLRVLHHLTTAKSQDTRNSRDQIIEAGYFHKDMLNYFQATVPALYIEDMPDGIDSVVTHAGVVFPENILSTIALGPVTEAVLGSSERDTAYRGASTYSADVDERINQLSSMRQFHGHRETKSTHHGNVYNLETSVTAGGALSAAVVSKEGVSVVSVPVTDKIKLHDNSGKTLRESMDASDLVRVKDLGNDLVSCNFTRDAFYTSQWTKETVTARGLFLEGNTVRGRGYNKFFALDDYSNSYAKTVYDTLDFPVTVSKKYNGFLAIVFVYRGELVVYTKSGPSDFAVRAQQILEECVGEDLDTLKKILDGTNTSALFEVIATDDPHIVDEGSLDAIYLLDVVNNGEVLRLRDDVADNIVKATPLCRGYREEVRSKEELDQLMAKYTAAEDCEGCVVTSMYGRMFKVKSDHYAMIKSHRTAFNRAAKGDFSRLNSMGTPLSRAVIDNNIDLASYTVITVSGATTVHIPSLVKDLKNDGLM